MAKSNLVKLAKGGKNTKTKPATKPAVKNVEEKPLTPEEERDLKAKQKVKELLSDVLLVPPTSDEVLELEEEGCSISLAQFNYINPLPYNVADIFSRFGKIIVCELNLGQFAQYLRSRLPDYNYLQFNKVQGLPFLISELKEKFREIIGKPVKK